MVRVKCPRCNRKVPSTSTDCPECGLSFENVDVYGLINKEERQKNDLKKEIIALFLVIILPLLIWFVIIPMFKKDFFDKINKDTNKSEIIEMLGEPDSRNDTGIISDSKGLIYVRINPYIKYKEVELYSHEGTLVIDFDDGKVNCVSWSTYIRDEKERKKLLEKAHDRFDDNNSYKIILSGSEVTINHYFYRGW